MSNPPELLLFLGRLHPLLVHLPIGLIVLLAFLELVALWPRFRNANCNIGLILALTAPAAVCAAGFGWLLSLAGGYDSLLLKWHFWTGLATAAVVVVAALLHGLKLRRSYRWVLFGGFALLVVASHFGGSLTHGGDYLTQHAPEPFRGWLRPSSARTLTSARSPTNAPAFAVLIHPILDRNCAGCHGPQKSKANLRLDTFAALTKGGDSGPVIVPGNSGGSELIRRMLLPKDDDERMPPEGKPQPTPDEIALLRWWIDAGASETRTAAEMPPTPEVQRILSAKQGDSAPDSRKLEPRPRTEVLPVAQQVSDRLGITISPLDESGSWLFANAAAAGTNFGDADLTQLATLAPNLRWLDLSGTAISNEGLAPVATMANLQRLHLEHTSIGDAGVACLVGLSELDYLNLYATEVSDAGLKQLEHLPRLRQLYLWQTKVSPEAGSAFSMARSDVAQLRQWQYEIEQLKAKIAGSKISVVMGTPPSTNSASTNTAKPPMNTECPVSGKRVDLAITLVHEGQIIAFCCKDCCVKFQKDPTPFLARLNPANSAAKAQ